MTKNIDLGRNDGPSDYAVQLAKNAEIGALEVRRVLAERALEDERFERRHYQVLFGLLVSMGNAVEVAPCVREIALRAKVSASTVHKALSDLRAWGYVTSVKRAAFGGGHAVAHYTAADQVRQELIAKIEEFIERIAAKGLHPNGAVEPETWSAAPQSGSPDLPARMKVRKLSYPYTGKSAPSLTYPSTGRSESCPTGPHEGQFSTAYIENARAHAPAPAHIFGKDDAENGKDENSEPSKPASIVVPLIDPTQKEAAGRPASSDAGDDLIAEAEMLASAGASEQLGITLPAAFADALASGTAKNSITTFRNRLAAVLSDGMPADHVEAELEKAVLHADERAGGNATVGRLLASGLSFLKNIRPPRPDYDPDELRPSYSARSCGRPFEERYDRPRRNPWVPEHIANSPPGSGFKGSNED